MKSRIQVIPAWKVAAMRAAAKQNRKQRAAARPATAGFSHCTTGHALSLIASFGGAS